MSFTLPNRLKELREKMGWTQQQVGEMLNVSDATINRYEKGLRNPDPKTLESFSKLYNTTIDYLMGLSEIHEQRTNYSVTPSHPIVGEKLRLLREERGLKQRDIAKHLDITPSAYGYYEQGEREPDLTTLNRLADYFNVTIDYLLGRSTIRNYKELEEKLSSGQLKVLAAHRSDNPLDELPPKARKSLEDAIRYIREEENKNQGDKPHD